MKKTTFLSQISKYASDERIEGIFCACRKLANFCHPVANMLVKIPDEDYWCDRELVILIEMMLDVVMGVMNMEVDKVANIIMNMEVDNVADEVADMEVNQVADMVVQ